jgi:hypothetical protein
MVEFAQKAAPLHEALTKALPSNNPDASRMLDQLHHDGQKVIVVACSYKATTENDFSTIRTNVLDPLKAVLNDPQAFGYEYPYVSKKREGPWVDPTSVTLTVSRSAAAVFATTPAGAKTATTKNKSYTCSSDTTDLFEYGDTYVTFKDFFSNKPVSSSKRSSGNKAAAQVPANIYAMNPNSPKIDTMEPDSQPSEPSNTKKGSGKKPATDDTTVSVQPWLFGKPRLVVSGGEGIALLSKQEFQRSTSINGTTTQTVVGLKTNTKVRNTPMLYGHTYLPWFNTRHDPEGFFATFGVTANSDNKGTAPEFLFGLSRSFAQQRFFLTAGAYLGERQKLDGGLYVGEVIPSSLTTDLPVTKSYHTGFAFGISYRFASTKTPQDNNKSSASGKSGN